MYKYKLKIEKFYIGYFDKNLKKDGKRVIEAFFYKCVCFKRIN